MTALPTSPVPAPSTAQSGASWMMAGPPIRGRSCGSCTACCTQVSTDLPDGHKPANVRCRHARSKGCSIYRSRPDPCRTWSCKWLFDAETTELRRPDHSGVIIDPTPDAILAGGRRLYVVQVWVDPKRRDAHRDPALRRYLAKVAETHAMPALVRWSSSDAMVLAAPCLTDGSEWIERDGLLEDQSSIASRLAEAAADNGTAGA